MTSSTIKTVTPKQLQFINNLTHQVGPTAAGRIIERVLGDNPMLGMATTKQATQIIDQMLDEKKWVESEAKRLSDLNLGSSPQDFMRPDGTLGQPDTYDEDRQAALENGRITDPTPTLIPGTCPFCRGEGVQHDIDDDGMDDDGRPILRSIEFECSACKGTGVTGPVVIVEQDSQGVVRVKDAPEGVAVCVKQVDRWGKIKSRVVKGGGA